MRSRVACRRTRTQTGAETSTAKVATATRTSTGTVSTAARAVKMSPTVSPEIAGAMKPTATAGEDGHAPSSRQSGDIALADGEDEAGHRAGEQADDRRPRHPDAHRPGDRDDHADGEPEHERSPDGSPDVAKTVDHEPTECRRHRRHDRGESDPRPCSRRARPRGARARRSSRPRARVTATMTRPLDGRLGSARSCTPAGSHASTHERRRRDDQRQGSPEVLETAFRCEAAAGGEQRHERGRREHDESPREQQQPAREAVSPGCDGGRLEQHQHRQR